ncbi:hypothetical protein KR038_009830 [Drosophila bunnanda]|nr:hypothetical protein KR038_009830 [Drosophila bunnanda]
MLAKLRRIYPGAKVAIGSEEPRCSNDLSSLETGAHAKKSRVQVLLSGMQQVLLFLAVFFMSPVLIYSGFKIFVLEPLYPADPDNNVAIGSAIATVIVMHVLVTGYILRLIFTEEVSGMEQQNPDSGWETLVPAQIQKHGPVLNVLLLMSYCALIVGFPIATFFALKFLVLKSFANIDADITSAICTVVAVHGAVGFFIYRAIYSKTPVMSKNQ